MADLSARVSALGKVAVLYGGVSAEREVSLRSGAGVLAALRSVGVDAHGVDPAVQSLESVKSEGFTRAFIALHGRYGEDGTLQGALELLKIPYTGSGVLASAMAMDKILTKRIWLSHGLPTPAFAELSGAVLADPQALAARVEALGYPLIIKPPHEGSTIGLTRVTSAAQLVEACRMAARFDHTVLAEQFIEGPELTVTLLGEGEHARALPIIEIRAPQGNYDFENKYNTDVTQYLCPAPFDPALTQKIQAYCLQAYRALGCSGWARADVMLRASDQSPFLLEINTSPGMTDHSLVPMAARASGLSYAELCLMLLESADLKIKQVDRTGASA
jgi:D-alanine-D-alanine ligase